MIFRLSSPFRLFAAALRTAWAKIAGYEVLAPEEIAADRLDVCSRCQFLTGDHQCKICGCFIGLKTALALEQCPQGFWRRIWIKKVKN